MVRHSKAKEAMFPYPANTISGTFFWKEVAPKAPSGLGSEAMVDPCLHPRETTWGPVYLQSQSGRSRARRALLFPITLSRTSWKASCLSGSLPWLPVCGHRVKSKSCPHFCEYPADNSWRPTGQGRSSFHLFHHSSDVLPFFSNWEECCLTQPAPRSANHFLPDDSP